MGNLVHLMGKSLMLILFLGSSMLQKKIVVINWSCIYVKLRSNKREKIHFIFP